MFFENDLSMVNYIQFKPTNQLFINQNEFQIAHDNFFNGKLTKKYFLYCVQQTIRAFWFNY